MAAMPSPEPVNPMPSVVVAVSDTSQPMAWLKACCASSRRLPISDDWPRRPRLRSPASCHAHANTQPSRGASRRRVCRHRRNRNRLRKACLYHPIRLRKATRQSTHGLRHHRPNHLRCRHHPNANRQAITACLHHGTRIDGRQIPDRYAWKFPYFFLDFLFSASTRAKVSMAASSGASV